MDPELRFLIPADAEAYVAFRYEMLTNSPQAFGASPDDNFHAQLELTRERLSEGSLSQVIGVFDPDLIGAVGMLRSDRPKVRHIMSIWGMYVRPGNRSAGYGRQLMESVLSFGRDCEHVSELQLSVSESALHARALYESVGFERWGTEPRALFEGGERIAVHHFNLKL
ncbi:MAG: ribosomal protein S18 acetylase RimI-like enzyme [Planctomycetota bacterium]|jgi:ribosomal protein S18 acetylase RimI-like enzyme